MRPFSNRAVRHANDSEFEKSDPVLARALRAQRRAAVWFTIVFVLIMGIRTVILVLYL